MDRSAGLARAAAAAIVAGGWVLSFLAGRWTAPAGDPPEFRDPTRSSSEKRTRTEEPPPETSTPDRPRDGRNRASPARTRGPGGEEVPADRPPIDLEPALAAARKAADAPEDETAASAALDALQRLEETILDDPAALARTIERFGRTTDPRELGFLAAGLGHVPDPEVEEAAVRIARGDADPGRRAAAFDVLDALDTPEATQVALEALSSEADPAVRLAALRAIPEPTGASLDEAALVVGRLADVLSRPGEAEARRRAALLLARWYRREADLAHVLEALERDPDPGVRAGCAYALEVAQSRTEPVFAALVRSLTEEREDPLVRENAWRALGALGPLGPEAHAAYEVYRETRDVEGEGGNR